MKRLEQRLDELAARAPRDPRGVPMTGAAGGLSGGLYAYRRARLVPGAAYVLDLARLRRAHARAAAFVVTGEGRLDEQTLAGKAAGEVAVRCRQAGVACHAVVGDNELEPLAAGRLGLASVRARRQHSSSSRPRGARSPREASPRPRPDWRESGAYRH